MNPKPSPGLKGNLYAWAVIAVALLSIVTGEIYDRHVLLASSTIQARPIFLFGLGMVGLWMMIWLMSLRSRSIPWPLALATLIITAFQPLSWLPMWNCVVGICEW